MLAIRAARAGNFDDAVEHIKKSQENINDVVSGTPVSTFVFLLLRCSVSCFRPRNSIAPTFSCVVRATRPGTSVSLHLVLIDSGHLQTLPIRVQRVLGSTVARSVACSSARTPATSMWE